MRFFTRCFFANCGHFTDVRSSFRTFFFHKKVRKLLYNATEKVTFVKTMNDWVFLKHYTKWVFRRKGMRLFKIDKSVDIVVDCVLRGSVSQNCYFLSNLWNFLAENRKLSMLARLGYIMRKEPFFERKRFQFPKTFFTGLRKQKCRPFCVPNSQLFQSQSASNFISIFKQNFTDCAYPSTNSVTFFSSEFFVYW